MKTFKNSKVAKTIISSAVAVMMAASAAVSLCCSTVFASTSTTTFKDSHIHNTAVTETPTDYVIKAKDGTTYQINKSTGSGVPLNFIGTDDYHYYIDNQCIAASNGYSGIIAVFDTNIWNNGRQLTQVAGVPLKDIIQFHADESNPGYVSDIKTCYEDGWIYDYTMHLHGKAGPSSWKNQYWIDFHDEEGDTYTIRLWSDSYKEHTIDYNSSAYRFNKIVWYNTVWQ